MRLADLIAPVPLDRFESDVFGRRPLHIPAPTGGPSKRILNWQRMNELLAVHSHWTEANLKLIMNSRPVQTEFYIDDVKTLGGPQPRADPAKVDLFLAMGASLVANSLEDISPEARAVTAALSGHYSAAANANAYCSFAAVQAFASHCDLHEVFAVQCEGEKDWRIYQNRADVPIVTPTGDDAQAVIDSAKGRILMEVRMRPGDLLYIPRGYYHDALATSEASLHVTFAVAPFTGRILFRLLEDMAMEDRAFRDYLPDARRESRALEDRLESLARSMSDLLRSEKFTAELGRRQRALAKSDYQYRLPDRQKLTFFARTDRRAELRGDGSSTSLVSGAGRVAIGDLGEPAEWLLTRRGFSVQELLTRFRAFDRDDLTGLVGIFEKMGLIAAYEPQLQ
jgi:hypothetical protein